MSSLGRAGVVIGDAGGIGQWTQGDMRDGVDGLMDKVRSALYAEGYTPEEVERVYWAVHERLSDTSNVSYRIDDHQTLVRIEGTATTPGGQVLQFGVSPRGGDMEWYTYDRQGDLLLLRDYRVIH